MAKLNRCIVLLTVIGFILGFTGGVFAADHVDAGKININTATAEELMQLKGVGEKIAASIIQHREKIGSFKSISDLEQVKGIGPKILSDNMDKLTI